MSDMNDEKLITSVQLKKQLNAINTDKPDIKHSLLDVVEKFQCLDHVANSIGLVKEGFSFVNRVSWETVLSKLEQSDKNENELDEVKLHDVFDAISQSSNQLEKELVPQLQKSRNMWMLEVILIEFVLLTLLTVVIAGVTYMQGLWSWPIASISIQPLFYERPAFSLIMGALLLISLVMIHFRIRNFVAKQMVKKLSKESSEFDLAGAFLKNTRIQHSIFRPDIIGWSWLSRKCLLKNRSEE